MKCGTDGAFAAGIRVWRYFGWNSKKKHSVITTCQLEIAGNKTIYFSKIVMVMYTTDSVHVSICAGYLDL